MYPSAVNVKIYGMNNTSRSTFKISPSYTTTASFCSFFDCFCVLEFSVLKWYLYIGPDQVFVYKVDSEIEPLSPIQNYFDLENRRECN